MSIVELLLKSGANVNTKDSLGNTPLHLAVKENNILMVILLIEKGANIKLKNRDHEKPIDIAKAKNFKRDYQPY